MTVKKKKDTQDTKESKEKEQSHLPPEIAKMMDAVRPKLEKFKDEIVNKFDKYIMGVGLLPKQQNPSAEDKTPKDQVDILVLIDDTEPSKMTKGELRDKLSAIIHETAQQLDKNLVPQTILLSDVWQSCYDGKYDLSHLVALTIPVYDTGMLSAIRIAEVHKSMVLKKFEKYIVSYVLAGSLVQGKATSASDIDVSIIVDDTDVKKMTRAELKDKLRAIIIGMGIEAGEITGVKNKINIQTWILTDFWDGIREANPVFFTFLRDGVPFYDRGIFMPWKQLLKMGKIKPSAEAIDIYMSSGEQSLGRVQMKLKDIGAEDFFYSILTPSQAALMLYGIPPPSPRETPELLTEIFVKKEKLLTAKDVATLSKVLKIRKDIEHGDKKEISGEEIDSLHKECSDYLKKLREMFGKIQQKKDEETMVSLYETVQTVCRDILRAEGVEKAPSSELLHIFEEELISTGKIPAKFLRSIHNIIKAKADYDNSVLSKTDIESARKDASELIKFLVEYLQRKRAREMDKVKFRVKHGEMVSEIILIGNTAFIEQQSENGRTLQKADIKPDGSLSSIEDAKPEDFEHAMAKAAFPRPAMMTSALFQSLQKLFGKDVEVFVG